jgi:hypothetical protein
MNCGTCGIEYRDDTPHPPKACLEHASSELKKAKTALDGALENLLTAASERDKLKTIAKKILSRDAAGKKFKLKADQETMKALSELL